MNLNVPDREENAYNALFVSTIQWLRVRSEIHIDIYKITLS